MSGVIPTPGSSLDVERARKAAFDAYLDGMHFHEVAIRDPFEAERVHLSLCKEILDCLGPPEGVRVVEILSA